MYGYVYLITNKLNGMKYVGLRASPVFDEKYWGSGTRIANAIKRYGKENFIREVLHWCETPEELKQCELDEHISRNVATSTEYYNLMEGSNPILFGEDNGFWGKTHSEETKQKISEANQGRAMPPEEKIRRQEFWNTKRGEERKLSLSKERKGKPLSPKQKEKISKSLKQIADKISEKKKLFYQTDKGKDVRISLSQNAKKRFTGVPKSPEHRKKISKALTGGHRENPHNKNPEKIRKTAEAHRGMKRSDESKKKMSEAAKNRGANNKGTIWIHNPETLERRMIHKDKEIPHGFCRGLGPRKKHKV
jgi:group I intron endonuclease